MKCSHIQERIPAYAEKELPLAQRLPVAWHLRRCEWCRAHLAEWVQTSQALALLRVTEPSADLLSRITETVATLPAPTPPHAHPPIRPLSLLVGWGWALLAMLGVAPFIASALCQSIANSAASATDSLTVGAQWSWGARELVLWCLTALARLVEWGADALRNFCWGLGENHLPVLLTWEAVLICGWLLWQRRRRARQTLMTLLTL